MTEHEKAAAAVKGIRGDKRHAVGDSDGDKRRAVRKGAAFNTLQAVRQNGGCKDFLENTSR